MNKYNFPYGTFEGYITINFDLDFEEMEACFYCGDVAGTVFTDYGDYFPGVTCDECAQEMIKQEMIERNSAGQE